MEPGFGNGGGVGAKAKGFILKKYSTVRHFICYNNCLFRLDYFSLTMNLHKKIENTNTFFERIK